MKTEWIEVNKKGSELPKINIAVLLWSGNRSYPPFIGTMSDNGNFYNLRMEKKYPMWWTSIPKMPV